jgi:hypothetical protein
VIDGWRYFGYEPQPGETDAEMARRHAEKFLEVINGAVNIARSQGSQRRHLTRDGW